MKQLSRRFLVSAFALFVAACVLRAPASLLTLILPPSIQLRNVEGSFWNGQAAAVGVGGLLVQEQVAWRFRPQSLLAARLEWVISGRLAERDSRLTLSVRASGVELAGVNVVVPLEPYAALHPRLKPAQLGAQLHVTTTSLRPQAPMAATVSVDQLSSPLVPQGELGSYTLALDAASDGKGTWRIAPVSGNLQITGQGQFDAGQSQIHGQVLLTAKSPMPGLTPVLAALPKVGEGYQLAF